MLLIPNRRNYGFMYYLRGLIGSLLWVALVSVPIIGFNLGMVVIAFAIGGTLQGFIGDKKTK